VDNTSFTYGKNYGNGVPISTYYGGENDDDQLLCLMDFLKQVQQHFENTGTVRNLEKRTWYSKERSACETTLL